MSGKIALVIIIVVIASIAIIFLSNQNSFNNQPPTPITEDTKTPIWGSTDLELYKVLNMYIPHNVITYDVTVSGAKPDYYKGSMPLRYNLGYYVQRSADSPLFYNFSDFTTYFVNNGPIIVGAQTQDKDEHILAEASNVTYDVKDNRQVLQIVERHYDPNGKIIFRCVSEIDASTNYKVKETEKVGTKLTEYYFMWPDPY